MLSLDVAGDYPRCSGEKKEDREENNAENELNKIVMSL